MARTTIRAPNAKVRPPLQHIKRIDCLNIVFNRVKFGSALLACFVDLEFDHISDSRFFIFLAQRHKLDRPVLGPVLALVECATLLDLAHVPIEGNQGKIFVRTEAFVLLDQHHIW